ncbi:metalloprotease family protein [Sutcliffiella horikoshii]|uniref:metalloprotease family protein n=1 Tax=Sutcliffiella horikoshii TaxID=79883 RepID=UPI003CFA8B81
MMLWFRPLPKVSLDPTVWAPFIQNNWYREHYMKFVYLLQVVLLFIPTIFSTQFSHIHTFALILTGFLVFWVFMSLPFIVLSIVPFVLSFYVSGDLKLNLLFISWFNTLISASDIINSFLIALKPKNALFCRGYVWWSKGFL